MLAYARGRAAAFDELYARHKGGVYRYLLRQCTQAGDADELFQDVWMKFIRARERYEVSAKFTTWLYTIARNRLVDHWRAKAGWNFESLDAEGDVDTQLAVAKARASHDEPDARLAARQLGEQLHAALATLPGAQRDAFLLQQEGEFSLAEIAQLTGVGIETVKSRLRYAVTRLRGELAPLHESVQ